MRFEKYEHSVLDVVNALIGHQKGSSDGFDQKTYRARLAWLHWRVTQAWDKPLKQFAHIDNAVKRLALAVLAQSAAPH